MKEDEADYALEEEWVEEAEADEGRSYLPVIYAYIYMAMHVHRLCFWVCLYVRAVR